ncbi:MAG: anion transporter [SAR86 cluster bacterium]|uniref:Anion transporter n=1 Tax=SAR86 cluster bacterium TaxID=2030880 RepID=A0A2A5C8N8_9GAMM|nr:MAG: anion transporter [SAR86 cluster bacterium]
MFSARQKVGLFLGPGLFILMLLLPVPEGMSPEAARVAAVAMLMASFWMAETVPFAATAMLPIFLFPLLKVMPTAEVTPAYGNHIIFLLMGGFLIAIAMQRWQLHRRIALTIICKVGSSPQLLLLGFMLATAVLSMWISNTATTMMMVPVAMAIIDQNREQYEKRTQQKIGTDYFGVTLMLGIAYAASIGGVSTLVGTTSNAIFVGMVETLYGIQISFFGWMKIGLPISLVMFCVAWWVLKTKLKNSPMAMQNNEADLQKHVRQTLDDMGTISREETYVALVFSMVALLWIVRGLFQPEFLSMISDPGIAMMGACSLFIIPAGKQHGGFLLDWSTAKKIPWDMILMVGGGFALAGGFMDSGLTEWLANEMSILRQVHFFIVILAVVLIVTFLTEVTSNAATVSLFVPVMGALALTMDLHPFALIVPVTIASSMAFMLPVATPPNAIVFASRQVTIEQMINTGIKLNLYAIVLISVLSYLLLPLIQQ